MASHPRSKRQRTVSALDEFRESQIVHIRKVAPLATFGAETLRRIIAAHATLLQTGWCDEGGAVPSPQAFLDLEGATKRKKAYYASAVVGDLTYVPPTAEPEHARGGVLRRDCREPRLCGAVAALTGYRQLCAFCNVRDRQYGDRIC